MEGGVGHGHRERMEAAEVALPPRELDASSLTVDVSKKIEELKRGLALIEAMDTPAQRSLAYQSLRKEMGLKENEFMLILQMLSEELMGDSSEGGFWDDVVANAKPITEAIERFLPFSAVTMLGADPGTGKTVFLYRIAEAVSYGTKFMGQLNCVQGNVLLVQKDESDSNLAQKNEKIQLRDPETGKFWSSSNSAQVISRSWKWIVEHKARYVVMDSFQSLFGGGADIKEAEAGLYLYQLNAIAAKHNVAILLTHHLKKLGDRDVRQNVKLSDFYGNTFIGAGTSDAGPLQGPGSRG